jgi:hypothetical protein
MADRYNRYNDDETGPRLMNLHASEVRIRRPTCGTTTTSAIHLLADGLHARRSTSDVNTLLRISRNELCISKWRPNKSYIGTIPVYSTVRSFPWADNNYSAGQDISCYRTRMFIAVITEARYLTVLNRLSPLHNLKICFPRPKIHLRIITTQSRVHLPWVQQI